MKQRGKWNIPDETKCLKEQSGDVEARRKNCNCKMDPSPELHCVSVSAWLHRSSSSASVFKEMTAILLHVQFPAKFSKLTMPCTAIRHAGHEQWQHAN